MSLVEEKFGGGASTGCQVLSGDPFNHGSQQTPMIYLPGTANARCVFKIDLDHTSGTFQVRLRKPSGIRFRYTSVTLQGFPP